MHAGIDEDADGDAASGLLWIRLSKTIGARHAAFVRHETAAVLKDHQGRGLLRVVLRGNVDPVIARRPGKILLVEVCLVTVPLGTFGCRSESGPIL